MKCSVSVVCVLSVAIAVELASASVHNEWRQFKVQYNKSYATRAEEARRFANFLASREQIARLNDDGGAGKSHRLGLNYMADWSEEEFALLNGLKSDEQVRRLNVTEVYSLLALDDAPLPAEVDWRQVEGRVTPVKNQGKCGSDWAFATIGLLEGQEALHNKGANKTFIKSLSEQELVDCSPNNQACDGGLMWKALDDISSLGGVESSADYPYKARAGGKCRFNRANSVISNAGSKVLQAGDEELIMRTLAQYGPLAVGIEATQQFKWYERGVFLDDSCALHFYNHGLLLVGYGTDPDDGHFWLLKNSWGDQWGEKGYVRFRRGLNMCGITEMVTVATF